MPWSKAYYTRAPHASCMSLVFLSCCLYQGYMRRVFPFCYKPHNRHMRLMQSKWSSRMTSLVKGTYCYSVMLAHSNIVTRARFACSPVSSRPGRLTQLLICSMWKAAKRTCLAFPASKRNSYFCLPCLNLSAVHPKVVFHRMRPRISSMRLTIWQCTPHTPFLSATS